MGNLEGSKDLVKEAKDMKLVTNNNTLEQPRPHRVNSIMNASSASSNKEGMKPSPSVSFSNTDQEKVRRFTISAQPSTVNLTKQEVRKNSLQNLLNDEGDVIKDKERDNGSDREKNLNNSSRNNSIIGSDFLLFFTRAYNSTTQPSVSVNTAMTRSSNSNNSSRVQSPITDPAHPFRYGEKITPSPPPALSPSTIENHPLTPVQSPHTVTNVQESSPSQPVSISRKSSLLKKSNKTVIESPLGPPVPFQQYLSKEDDGKIHILLAATGSVATIKVPLIIDKLFQVYGSNKISIQLVITKSASHFLKGLKINNQVKIWRDEDEWANFDSNDYFSVGVPGKLALGNGVQTKKKNPFDRLILHNELRKWADIMLIAPLSANTLAKIANGLSDNLLTSIVRSWNFSPNKANISASNANVAKANVKKPLLVAPAMNTFMYTHPLTAKQLNLLLSSEYGFGIEILKPVEKILVCGDIGMGGMREWSDIVDIVRRRISVIKQVSEEQIDEEEEDENEEEDEDDEDDEDDEEEDEEDEDDDDEDDDEDEDKTNEDKDVAEKAA